MRAMNKRTVRAFALGILFAAVFLGAHTYIFGKDSKPSVEEAKAVLEEQGFIVSTKSEDEKISKEKAPATEEEERTKKEDKAEEQPEEKKNTEAERVITYQLEIQGGMNTEEIASILEREKIIDDQHRFEEYLIEHEYNTKVQIGKFELNSKMDYEEISRIITKNS